MSETTTEQRRYRLLSGAVPANVCSECAALVWDVLKHDRWHDRTLPLSVAQFEKARKNR
jgi:hypothetical protein